MTHRSEKVKLRGLDCGYDPKSPDVIGEPHWL